MTLPFVSCICVTKNRRILLRRAAEYFERSRYLYAQRGGSAEFVVVDGSNTPNRELGNLSTYVHAPSETPRTGYFHNVACENARGDVIIQWDDDDWQNPYRIVRQVKALELAEGQGFTFSSAFWWYHLSSGRACKARSWEPGEGSTGAIFAYHRAAWKAAPFREVDQAEDIGFSIDQAKAGTKIIDARDPTLFVYVRHNVNGSALTNYAFTDEDTGLAREVMGADVEYYDELGELLPLTPWNHPNKPGSKMHALSPLQMLHLRHFR